MIYNELIEILLTELESKMKFKLEPGEFKRIQQYVEAHCELLSNENTGNINTCNPKPQDNLNHNTTDHYNKNHIDNDKDCKLASRIEIQSEIIDFLNSFVSKHKDKRRSSEETSENTMFMVGTSYALLGKCFINGLFGLKRNYEKAVEYLKKSAACKHPLGTFELARCFDLGIGTDRDPEQACQLYRASYKLGYIKGLHKYGILLIRGNLFVEKNVMDGFYILKQAVSLNDKIYIRPYYDLGMLYKSGITDTLNDHFYAFKIFVAGAFKGCKYCQYKLGEEYETGEIEVKNLEKAFYWYKLSAINGLSDAQHKVAMMLYGIKTVEKIDIEEEIETKYTIEGKVVLLSMNKNEKIDQCSGLELGVFKNKLKLDFEKFYGPDFNRLNEAYQMAYKAAVGGRKEAVLLVAEALEKGFGIERNIIESIWWYKIADSLGCDNVREKINTLESVSKRERLNRLKA